MSTDPQALVALKQCPFGCEDGKRDTRDAWVPAGPQECMWRSGHDGEGPEPSRFFCDVIGPPPSCHLYRAVADTEVEARALAFAKADPSFATAPKGVGNIVLISQDAEPGYQLHGLFRSFSDAADHAAKDEDNEHTPIWPESSDRQQWVTARTVWVASRQPLRLSTGSERTCDR